MESLDASEKKHRRENALYIKTAITTLSCIFKRQQSIDDLMLRSCLFVDKLSMVLEVSTAMMKTLIDIEIEDEKLPESLRSQVDTLVNILKEELDALMVYCRSPSFSPDAPFGAHLVKNTTFYENAAVSDNNV